jgi:multidrug efflux pump subunit AcrA (membrane-fusion protein)
LRPVDLSAAQQGLDSAAADAFATARTAAEKVADEQARAALLAHVEAAQRQYETTAATTRALVRQVQQGLAGIGAAVAALGAAQRAQAQAAHDVAAATVDALTLRAPIAGVVQIARPPATGSTDPLIGLLGTLPGGAAAAAGSSGAPAGPAGIDDVVAIGDPVQAGSAIVTIVDVSEIGLVAEVDETDVLLVGPGIAADVELDAAPQLRFAGTVETVDILPTPSAAGGVAYRVRLRFEPAETGDGTAAPTPRPGMSAVVHLRVREAVDALTVPVAAVFSSADGDSVWVVREGRAVRTTVTVGVRGEDVVEISDGLQVGQRVVVGGADRVIEGQELPG